MMSGLMVVLAVLYIMQDEKNFELSLLELFNNALSPEDEAALFKQINEDIEKRQYFENFESIWRLASSKQIAEIDLELELGLLKNKIGKNSARIISIGLPEVSEPNIRSKKQFGFARLIRGLVAVACLVLIFIVIRSFYNTGIREESAMPTQTKAVKANVVYHEINESKEAKLIKLNDGSRVLLFEKSEITYLNNFDSLRNVVLTGKARFVVSKDKKRPFTVFGGGVSTQVLGTQFTVTAYHNSKTTVVQLHEGRVVVKLPDGLKKPPKNYFLRAGQELFFNKRTFEVNIITKNPIRSIKKLSDVNFVNKDLPDFPQDGSNSWYMFNNQSLSEVFEQLASMYNVTISYKKQDIKNRKFIGMFNQTDSLENILKLISTVNDLKVKKNKNGFVLYKQ